MATAAHHGLALDLRDLRVAFADRDGRARTILAVPGFHVAPRERVAICGPSGSGKTTLLNIIAGIERPDHGVVRWGEVTVSALPERAADRWRRETLGLVFQHFHLFPGMSAIENVMLPLRFDRWSIAPGVRADARDLLVRVGIRPDADARALSRGEMQRVALARALLRRPAIMIADEPTASLDRDNAEVVADLLCALCRDAGATLIVATHDPHLADRLGLVVDIAEGDLRPRGAAPRWPRLVPVA
jgi:putative ABC transport system ATP-binding protein